MKTRLVVPFSASALVLVLAVPAYAAVGYSYYPDNQSFNAYGDGAADVIAMSCVSGEVSPAAATPAPCATLEAMSITPGEGSDSVDLSAMTAADFPALTRLSITDDDDFVTDYFTGSDIGETFIVGSADDVDAGAGDDVVTGGRRVEAGPGDDVLVEVGGADGADGGPGDDRFVQTLARGGNDGGPGYDVMQVDLDRASGVIDGLSLVLTPAQLQISTPDGDQSVFIANFEEFHVHMARGGDQSMDASAFAGRLVYHGARTPDTVTGSDLEDIIATRAGDDKVFARDGEFDLIDCGAGTDTAVVDAIDRVSNCENVSYPRPQTSTISGPRKITKGSSASYSFGSPTADAVFQCKVDKLKWAACTSPHTLKAKGKLKKGKHTLKVRAGYPAGNWDKSPSKKKIKIKK